MDRGAWQATVHGVLRGTKISWQEGPWGRKRYRLGGGLGKQTLWVQEEIKAVCLEYSFAVCIKNAIPRLKSSNSPSKSPSYQNALTHPPRHTQGFSLHQHL